MICARGGTRAIRRRSSARRSRPSKRILPASGSISRSTSRLTVDLPQPDLPTSASVLPARREKLTPSTALTKRDRAAEQPTLGDEMLDQAFDFEQRGHDTSLSSGALMQREPWPGLEHRQRRRLRRCRCRSTNGQRGAKRQPGGGVAMFGTMPSMVARCVRCGRAAGSSRAGRRCRDVAAWRTVRRPARARRFRRHTSPRPRRRLRRPRRDRG